LLLVERPEHFIKKQFHPSMSDMSHDDLWNP